MPIRKIDAARGLGVDPSQVTRWVRRGMPLGSLADARAWREAVAGRRIRADLRGKPAPAVAPYEPPPRTDAEAPASMAAQLLAERLRRERAEADRAELGVLETKGELVRVDVIRAEHARRVVAVKTRLLDLGPRLAPRMVGVESIAAAQALIDAEVRAAMQAAAADADA